MALWLSVLLGVALLAWVAAAAWRRRATATVLPRPKPPPDTPAPTTASQPTMAPTPAPTPAPVPERAAGPVPEPAAEPPPPQEDEEAEFTMVTALPPSLRRPNLGSTTPASATPDGAPPSSSPGSLAPPSHPPKVDLHYEDEADIDETGLPMTRILVSAQGQSDGGRVRRRNEDSFLVVQERSLFVVADGMGGYRGGDIASALAVETVAAAFETDTFLGKTESAEKLPRRGREMALAIQMANQAILERVAREPALVNMGTTLVAARFSPNRQRVYIGHVGDSRCYRLRGNTLKQMTTDHTFLGLGLKGKGEQHLYQALGLDRRITIDVAVDRPRPGDRYLLCSDGLNKMARDDEIRDILLEEEDLERAVYALIALANAKGGKDNVTVILVKVLERRASSARIVAADKVGD